MYIVYRMETAVEEIITDKTVSPVFQRAINAKGLVDVRANEIKQELARVRQLVLHSIRMIFTYRASLQSAEARITITYFFFNQNCLG